MKKPNLFISAFLMICCALLPFISCSKYDDTAINERVDQIEERVGALETLVSQLNSSLSGLVTSIDALKNQDKIVSVTRTPGDDGWNIVFEKAGTISVYDGKNGVNGVDGATHQIGVRKDDDGLYYWTIDGEWLIEDGVKVPATAQVVVPQIKIEDGKFLFSTDGINWTVIGDAGTSGVGIVSDVRETDNDVTLVLSDSSEITIPKIQQFMINIEGSSFAISDGGTCRLFYEILGADDQTRVKAYAESGYTVDVAPNKRIPSKGSIKITAPDEAITADIIIIATNGKGQMCGKIISIEKGVLTLVDETLTIGANGGEVVAKLQTNTEYVVMIDPSAGWIHEAPETKATRTDEIKFLVDENTTDQVRTGQVFVTNDIGMMQILNITQDAKSEESTVQTGGISDFETFSGELIENYADLYSTVTTTKGWVGKNIKYVRPWTSIGDGNRVACLSGDNNLIGTITSPEIEGGCGTLTIAYGTNSDSSYRSKNISAKVDVMNENGELVQTFIVEKDKDEIVEQTVYSFEKTLNQSGKFKIIMTNNSVKNQAAIYNTFAVISVSWTGYSE